MTYSWPSRKPDSSSTRERITSPQLPWSFLSPFRALVRLLASSLICLFRPSRRVNCSFSAKRSRDSLPYVVSTFSRKSLSCSRSGESSVSSPVRFCSVNFCDFSSKIRVANCSNCKRRVCSCSLIKAIRASNCSRSASRRVSSSTRRVSRSRTCISNRRRSSSDCCWRMAACCSCSCCALKRACAAANSAGKVLRRVRSRSSCSNCCCRA